MNSNNTKKIKLLENALSSSRKLAMESAAMWSRAYDKHKEADAKLKEADAKLKEADAKYEIAAFNARRASKDLGDELKQNTVPNQITDEVVLQSITAIAWMGAIK